MQPGKYYKVPQTKPEHYDMHGNIINTHEPAKPYTRTMSAYDQHRIHQTKDTVDAACTYCVDKAKQRSFFICSECQEDCQTRKGLDNHWTIEH